LGCLKDKDKIFPATKVNEMKKHIIVFLTYFFLSLIVTWPLIVNLTTQIMDPHDGLLITWIINWNVHIINSGISQWPKIFDANIFYPLTNTLAYSDYHLLSSLIAWPFVTLFKEPLLAFNVNFLFGFCLTAFSTYLLGFEISRDRKVSFLGGILFAFSAIHLSYMTHLQLFDFYPVILSVYFLAKEKFVLFCSFFILSVLNSPLNLYFLLLLVFSYVFFNRRHIWRTIMVIVFCGLACLPLLWPFMVVSKEFGYVRPIKDTIHFSLKYFDLWTVAPTSRMYMLNGGAVQTTPAFFGGVFLFLLAWMTISGITSLKNQDHKLKAFLLSALGSFVLSFGPAFHIFANTIHVGIIPFLPMPYLILYYLLPGFSAFRTPSRWILLTAFSLVIVLVIHFRKKLSAKWVVVLSSLVILEINAPFVFYSVPNVENFPVEQEFLVDNHVGESMIQFPIYNWSDKEFGIETMREYYSTIHWHPMFNGFSGFSPEVWQKQVFWLQQEFPSPKTVAFLKEKQIKLVLVPITYKDALTPYSELKLIQEFPQTLIYRFEQ